MKARLKTTMQPMTMCDVLRSFHLPRGLGPEDFVNIRTSAMSFSMEFVLEYIRNGTLVGIVSFNVVFDHSVKGGYGRQ